MPIRNRVQAYLWRLNLPLTQILAVTRAIENAQVSPSGLDGLAAQIAQNADADSNDYGTEELTIVHEYIVRVA